MPKLITLTAGLFLAATAQLLAFAMTGAGHGWLAPFLSSFLLWLTYPAVGMFLLRTPGAKDRWSARADVWLLAAAVLADLVLLVINDWNQVPWFYRNYPWLVVGWVMLWIGWQLPPVWVFSRRLAKQFGPA
ncbi:MAG TPA: hypothetical protein VGE68_10375 [Sphingomicrobium sp.]